MTRVLIILVFSVIGFDGGYADAQCLKCEPTPVTLRGVIYSKDFPGPPNYQSVSSGDERMRYWILRLNKPICVEGDEFDKAPAPNTRDLQLVFADKSFYDFYRPHVGRGAQFRVVGTLFHQQTGHHVTKILVNVKSVVKVRNSNKDQRPKFKDLRPKTKR